MTSRDFCYWLQGYFEIHNVNMPNNQKELRGGLTNHQVDVVRKHLALVFKHEIDPGAGPPEHQAELNAIHSALGMITPTGAPTPEPSAPSTIGGAGGSSRVNPPHR